MAGRRGRRAVALTVCGGLSAAGLLLNAGTATADDPVSQAQGQFLSGSVIGVDLAALLAVLPAAAHNVGSQAQVLQLNPLSVALLNANPIPIGALNLLGPNALLTLGAVGQYAEANDDGSAVGAAGAVTDSGAIGLGGTGGIPLSNAALDLSPLLGAGATGLVSSLGVQLDSIAARAAQAAGSGGAQSGSYDIANLRIDLTSPAVAQVLSSLRTTLVGLQALVDGIVDALNAIVDPLNLGLLEVSGLPNLADLVDALGTVTSSDGSLQVNLGTGTIAIDVAHLVDLAGPDIDHLDPNTDLLPLITATLTTQLLPTIVSVLNDLSSDLSTALNGLTVTVAGLPINAGILLGVLSPVLSSVTGAVSSAVSGLDPLLDDVVAGVLPTVLGLEANVQDSTAGTFTQTALRLTAVPGSPAAAVVNLASASVGPNAGPADPTPTPTPTPTPVVPTPTPTPTPTPAPVMPTPTPTPQAVAPVDSAPKPRPTPTPTPAPTPAPGSDSTRLPGTGVALVPTGVTAFGLLTVGAVLVAIPAEGRRGRHTTSSRGRHARRH